MSEKQNNLSILMYGWEYPPNISGGLGVACHAIVQALAQKNIKINLVLPHEITIPTKTNDHKSINLFGVDLYDDQLLVALASEIQICKIDSLLHPYLSAEEYRQNLLEHSNTHKKNRTRSLLMNSSIDHNSSNFTPSKFAAHYGKNLIEEVVRYGEIGGSLAENLDHDVIHAHDWMTILAGVKAKHISHKPLIFHIHALELDRCGFQQGNQQIFDIEKYGMEQADHVIAVSNYTKNIIVQYYGIPAEKISVVYNGIHQSYANKNSNPVSQKRPKLVLFLGRVTQQKGPSFFIDIAQKIIQKRPDVQFVVAGTGNLLAETIEKVAALQIGKNVHFTGFLNPATVKKLYQIADVYVMPSVSEPFGISCLEALAYDVPVVISKQSGAAEALKNTLSVDFWDTNEMASKILALLEYSGLRKELLSNVKQEMQHLTWEQAGDKILAVYTKLKQL